jgi:DNA-binding transcriptional MerR regulator
MSPTANPQTGRTRLFTDEDLKVFDLINSMREDDKSYEDIHIALKAGERGAAPAVSPEEVRAIVTGEIEKQLSLEIQILRRQLALAEERVKEYDELKEANIRLQTERDSEKRRADELAEQLKAAQDKMESTLRELGRAYHEGYLEGMKHQDTEHKDD